MAVWQHTRLLFGVAALAIGVGCGTDSVVTPAEPKEPQGPQGPTPPPPPVLSIAAFSPLELEGMTGRPVTPTPQVQVTDEQGKPVAAVRVSFLVSGSVGRSGSHIESPSSWTNANGVATAGGWWLGWQAGVQELTASISGEASVTFRATAVQEDVCAAADACTEADLAFIRQNAVFAVALPHSQPVKLADNASKPAWSPDGSRIAFGRPGPYRADIWQLCIADFDIEAVRCATGSFHGSFHSRPSWSPDGSTVAFTISGQPTSGGHFNHMLYHLDVASMVVRTISTVALRSVSWSPDGSTLAFATKSGALGVMNADGSGMKILAERLLGRFSAFEVVWSPDGRQFAASFIDEHSCPWDCDMAIGVMNADGTELRLLAHSSATEGMFLADPVWSPDGRQIAYTREGYSSAVPSDVLIVSAQGGAPKVLLADASSASWRR